MLLKSELHRLKVYGQADLDKAGMYSRGRAHNIGRILEMQVVACPWNRL